MWDWELFREILPLLFKGFIVTVQVTLLSFCLALVAGLVLALMRRSKNRVLSWPAGGFVEFVRSTPLLVQLYFLYYVLPQFGLSLPALTLGVIGLGLHYSTYMSEIYRAGIQSVPKGQWEASGALSFSRLHLWTAVVLPQALPPIIPALGNRLIAMFKETPILAAITVSEMLLVAREIGSERFSYLVPYTTVGLFFLLASLISSVLVSLLERRDGTVAAGV